MHKLIFLILTLAFAQESFAWGKRGHETVASLAAQLLATENSQAAFLKNHSFDMGFYANVPDLYWKREATYAKEGPQHYVDMEAFTRAFEAQKTKEAWNPDRQAFFKKFPDIEVKEGRSFWRIQELNTKLEDVTKKLKAKKLTRNERQDLQIQWITIAGVMSHYIGDLAQPLHVTENHDGQLSEQKGLHHWLEEEIVDDLYPSITNDVYTRAKSRWAEFSKKNKKLSAFELAVDLAKNSSLAIPEVLHLDKTHGRANLGKISGQYKELVTERLAQGVLYLALVWSKQVGWEYDGKRFYQFSLTPDFIEPTPDKKQ